MIGLHGVREDPERDCDGHEHEHGDRTAMPALFSLSCVEGEGQQNSNAENWHDQDKRRLKYGRKIGENGVDPEKEEVGLGVGLNDGGVRLTVRAVGAEYEGADGDRSKHGA
jgi:hypothetical protein